MKDKGAVLLIAVLAILILGMAAAALLMVRPSAGSSAAPATRPGPDFAVALARTPAGVTATLSITNPGFEDLSDLRIARADLASLTLGTPLPLVLGKVPRGSTLRLVLPYTGAAPAANAPLQLMLDYDYKYGAFGNGSGSRDLTAILP